MSRLKLPPNPRHLAPSGPGSLAGAVTTAGAVRVAHCLTKKSSFVAEREDERAKECLCGARRSNANVLRCSP